MNETHQIPLIGTPLYCPDCRRLLVSFNDNGTINLAGLATVTTVAYEYLDEDGDVCLPADAVVMEATCHRQSCRRKRFARNLKEKMGWQ